MRKSKKKLFRRGTEQKYPKIKHIYAQTKKPRRIRKVTSASQPHFRPVISMPFLFFSLLLLAIASVTFILYQMRVTFVLPSVEIPKISFFIPKVTLPTITFPEISTPNVEFTLPALPDFSHSITTIRDSLWTVANFTIHGIQSIWNASITFIVRALRYFDPRPLLITIYYGIFTSIPYLVTYSIKFLGMIDPLPLFRITLEFEISFLYILGMLLIELLQLTYAGLIILFEITLAVSQAIFVFLNSVYNALKSVVYSIYLPLSKFFSVLYGYTSHGIKTIVEYVMFFVMIVINAIEPSIELFKFTFKNAGEFMKAVSGS